VGASDRAPVLTDFWFGSRGGHGAGSLPQAHAAVVARYTRPRCCAPASESPTAIGTEYSPSASNLHIAIADNPGMSLPRAIAPGRRYMITRRRSERRFFMRPDRETNNAFVTSAALARSTSVRRYPAESLPLSW